LQNEHMRTLTGPLFLSIINCAMQVCMDKEKLKLIVRNLKSLVEVLESEVYSDVDAYKYGESSPHITDYDEVFYDGDDDGYPD